jgi:heparan-alpha-glucosaminide N-acetyltransferase
MTAPPAPTRLVSLDAYRGLVMLTLLFGSVFHPLKDHPVWHWLYLQNEHVEWEGCSLWDLIQPAFMFIVGVAMPFAFAVRSAKGDTWAKQLRHVIVRAGGLILVGVVLDNFGASTWTFGFIRVLQQIAFGYVLAFFVLGRPLWVQGLAAAFILVGYSLFWVFNPWNGPDGPWAMGGENAGRAFDRWMLGLWWPGRNYTGHYVGLNAIPEAANMIFGVMAGQWIANAKNPYPTAGLLALAGVAGITFGLAATPFVPLIKRIWTPSFAVFSAGWTTLALAGFYWFIDVFGYKKWTFPLVVVGMNSIAAYVMTGVFGNWFRSLTGAWLSIFAEPLGPIGLPIVSKLLFVTAAWLALRWLYRRRIIFKL